MIGNLFDGFVVLQVLLLAAAVACLSLALASSLDTVPTSDSSRILRKSGVIVSNGTGGNYVPDGPAQAKVRRSSPNYRPVADAASQ